MSLNVLIIPEDFRKDQYILKPIIEKMIESLGYRATVRVCTEPLLGGVVQAMKWSQIDRILNRYKGMVTLFLLIVDRDGDPRRDIKLRSLEEKAEARHGGSTTIFLAASAWQEVEVWALAGQKNLPKAWKWSEIRSERNPKETYYRPYVRSKGLEKGPYEGRDVLGREAAKYYKRVKRLCPEDVKNLEERIRLVLNEKSAPW